MESMFTSDLIGTGFKTLAMLFIVLGLLILILYVLKRMSLLKRGGKNDIPITIISSLYLSPKERIEVIEISGEKLVLGISAGNISFLTKLKEESSGA